MTHTPGPWSAKAIYELLRFARKNGGPWDDIGEDYEFFPDEDDAQIIAAAPDMLEVLEELDECAEYWSEYDVPLGLHGRIKAAIKLGRGE